MAGSAVIGALRVLLQMDTADFEDASVRVSRQADQWSKSLGTIGRQAEQLGRSLTRTLTLPIAGLAAGAAKAAIDFESSFAGVRKTVDATEPEFQAMAQAFRKLSTEIPINVNELNRLGEAAGALGIPKEEIVDFSRVMALLGVTTNVTSDQAAESIAKIQNIFAAAGKDTDRFAATLVALGNDGASTEAQILEMSTRIAGAGNAINLTQGEVLAFASALSSVGIEAEMGGSAISRVFIDIASAVSQGGDTLADFAKVSGMAAEQFTKQFKTDAAGAVNAFILGLSKIKNSGGDLLGTLDALGFSEIRVRDTLLRTAGAGELLTRALNLQQEAWQDNSALTEEARKRFETTASQLTLLWNRVKDVGITLGNALLPAITKLTDLMGRALPLVEGMAKWFSSLSPEVQLAAFAFAGLAAALGPVAIFAGQVAEAARVLIGLFAAKGLATKALGASAGGLAATLGVLAAKAAAVVSVGFGGWHLGKLIGETTGLTDKVEWLTGRLMGLTDAQIEAGRQARIQHEAQQKQTEVTNELASAESIAAEVTRAMASAQQQTAAAILQTTAQKKAAQKASEDLQEQIDKERDALRNLGLVTQRDVNEQIATWTTLMARATAEGVPMGSFISAVLPKLEDLAERARQSGLDIRDLTAMIRDAKTQLIGMSTALSPALLMPAVQALQQVSQQVGSVSVESLKAATSAAQLQAAYSTLGITSRTELQRTAAEARAAYERILQSGTATYEQLQIARQKLLEAEQAASEGTQKTWSEMLSAIENKFANWGATIGDKIQSAVGGPVGVAFGAIGSQLVGSLGTLLTGGLNQLISFGVDLAMKGLKRIGSLIWDGLKAFGGLFKSEGAKTNDTRDDWMAGLGGLEGAHALIGEHGNDAELLAAFERAYFASGRNAFGSGVSDFNARLEELMAGGMMSFEKGTNGQYVDFGAGTLAMLHGRERVMTETEGKAGAGASVVLNQVINVYAAKGQDAREVANETVRQIKNGVGLTDLRLALGVR